MSEINIRDLAQTYSELIDLDDTAQGLLHSAIERSIDARQIVGGQTISKKASHPLVAGGISAPTHQPKECPVLINGIVLCDPPQQPRPQPQPKHPPYFPIGKIAVTDSHIS